MEELLEQAKQMFPIGTVYDNSNLVSSGGRRTVTNIPYTEGNNIRVNETASFSRWLYKNGEWAKIISSPVNKEPSYEIY